LEVLTNGHKELFASPGDSKFSGQHPIDFAGSGVLGNGFFGLYLRTILLGDKVSCRYQGPEEVAGRHLVRYTYRLPAMWSGEHISLKEGSGTVGLRGSFWADSQTLDVVRLDINAEDFPPALPLKEVVTRINYGQTILASGMTTLLPQSGDFRMVTLSGETSHNQVEFTHCHQFDARRAIDFEPHRPLEQTWRSVPVSFDDKLKPLPSGLRIAVKMRSEISSDMAVGALIEGAVMETVAMNGSGVIPGGSLVRGRLRRMERYTYPTSYFVIALEFTEIEIQGIRHRFYADLVAIDGSPAIAQTLSTRENIDASATSLFDAKQLKRTTETLYLDRLPGVAAFFFRGTKLVLPKSFRTIWKTHELAS
jgi:hypothetical protein